jgi:hypothetical protein
MGPSEDAALEHLKFILLADWQVSVTEALTAKLAIEKEQVLRKKVMEAYFPTPKEGVNSFPLANGYELKATHKLDRKIDIAALPAVFEQLRGMGINPDPLIEMKPSLATTPYRSLLEINPAAGLVFDQALTIKPASPTIELKAPKAKA